MPTSIFNEIKIMEDNCSDKEVILDFIKTNNQEDAFHVLDVSEVIAKHKLWLDKLPRIAPFFAVKCNPNPTVIKTLAQLNGRFDCASKSEIVEVMKYGVSADRIIYANPVKAPSQLQFAKMVGVDKMTADCENELFKIKDLFPEAKVIIRFRCDSNNSTSNLGLKYGCDPSGEALELIQLAKSLGLYVYGFSFHVGSPCGEILDYDRGIRTAKQLIDYARSIGCQETCLIDIGGGFPGEAGFVFDKIVHVINEAIKDMDSSIEIISEPGRYYVTTAFSSVASVHGKKSVMRNNRKIIMYYVNDGTYGTFLEELLKVHARTPSPLKDIVDEKKYLSTIWGPTCDSMDCIVEEQYLPAFKVGDWLIWKDMGAYTLASASTFNGFHPPVVYPFIRKSDWGRLQAETSKNISNGTTKN